ncbi:MAG: hypothetical protein ACFFCO_12775 [Promethearchaeota archaeon]
MSEEIDLKEIERKAYLSYHQDGLIDVFIGLAALFLATFLWLAPDMLIFIMGTMFMWTLLYIAAKKSVTVPRLGYVEFSKERNTKTSVILLYIVVLNIVSLVISWWGWLNPSMFLIIEAHGFLVVGAAVASIFVVVAYSSGIHRFYAYGVVTLLAFSVSHFLVLPFYLPILSLGLVMAVAGMLMLYLFIRKYPKESTGEELDARSAAR